MTSVAKPNLRPKLFYLRSNGERLQAVMTLQDGTCVVHDIDFNWCKIYVPLLLDWLGRRVKGLC